MALFDKIEKFARNIDNAIDAFKQSNNKPLSFHRGEDFELFTERLFSKTDFTLISRTNNYQQNQDNYSLDTLLPDYKFKTKDGSIFYIEAKFRTDLFNGKYQICSNEKQLNRYKQVSIENPVFILFGYGGYSDEPENLSLIPISVIKYPSLFPNNIEPFKLDIKKYPTIKPALINKLLKQYF